MTPEFKVAKAKAALVLEQPFFASLACNLPWIKDDTIRPKTMCTNGKWVKWHSEFVEKCTLDELKFVACHEIMHVVYEHILRRSSRHPVKWNQACDYVINDLLVKEQIGVMPKEGLLNPALAQAGNFLSERVYDLLPDFPPDKGGSSSGQGGGSPGGDAGNGHGNPLDECQDAGGSQAEQEVMSAEIKIAVAQAAQAAKMCGKLSANMERFVGEVLKPKVDWRSVLRRFVSARARIEASFARPKRRFMDEDFILPSLDGISLGTITVAVDCSGSIGERELNEFAAEIRAIFEDLRPKNLHVVYFDSRVCHHDAFEQDDTLHIEPHGGGGTAFSPIFKFVSDKDIDTAACIVLTDLCCSDFGPPPEYPVLWVATMDGSAPWGEIVRM